MSVVAICCNFLPGFQNVGASMRAPKAAKVPVSHAGVFSITSDVAKADLSSPTVCAQVLQTNQWI